MSKGPRFGSRDSSHSAQIPATVSLHGQAVRITQREERLREKLGCCYDS